MKIQMKTSFHAVMVVDVMEGGTLQELLNHAEVGPFKNFTILERHAGEIGDIDTQTIEGERYYIIGESV